MTDGMNSGKRLSKTAIVKKETLLHREFH